MEKNSSNTTNADTAVATKVGTTRIYGTKNKVILVKGDLKFDNLNGNENRYVKPDDQLKLSKAEREEEHARILTLIKPSYVQNLVKYDYKERKFVKLVLQEDSNLHLNITGNLLSFDTKEARNYIEQKEKLEIERRNFYAKNLIDEYIDSNGNKAFRVLKNRFNYYDRATQTFNSTIKDASVETDTPGNLSFSGYISQHVLYDIYKQDYEDKIAKMQMQVKKPAFSKTLQIEWAKKKRYEWSKNLEQKSYLLRMIQSAKLIERMLAQNSSSSIAEDFKYFDDPADMFKKEGTLLPLWKFSNELTRKMWITSVSWNKVYGDLFAVSTGSRNFFDQKSGLIVIYSLKSPENYEFRIETQSGCMCVDFNHEIPYFLCAGFYNGTIAVYDLRKYYDEESDKNRFCFKSAKIDTRHSNPIWQIRWLKQDNFFKDEQTISFCSISTDGQIIKWTFKDSSELIPKNIICIENDDFIGTCFDFNQKLNNTIIIGTQKGIIYESLCEYVNQLVTSYEAHDSSTQAVKWNAYYKRVFLSCSADLTLKIWDHRYRDPIYAFEFDSPIVDADWAPYSSTVFAALTIDGLVYVYDLYVDDFQPLCAQNVLDKQNHGRKFTRLAFNPSYPIILIADEKGFVFTFKLSPNLRSIDKEAKFPSTYVCNKENSEISKIRQILNRKIDSKSRLACTSRPRTNLKQQHPSTKMNLKSKNEHF